MCLLELQIELNAVAEWSAVAELLDAKTWCKKKRDRKIMHIYMVFVLVVVLVVVLVLVLVIVLVYALSPSLCKQTSLPPCSPGPI